MSSLDLEHSTSWQKRDWVRWVALHLREAQAKRVLHLGASEISNFENLDLDSVWFDAVVIDDLLLKAPRPASVILEISRILKPGGLMFLQSRTHRIWSRIRSTLPGFLRPDEIENFCANAGLQVIEWVPLRRSLTDLDSTNMTHYWGIAKRK